MDGDARDSFIPPSLLPFACLPSSVSKKPLKGGMGPSSRKQEWKHNGLNYVLNIKFHIEPSKWNPLEPVKKHQFWTCLQGKFDPHLSWLQTMYSRLSNNCLRNIQKETDTYTGSLAPADFTSAHFQKIAQIFTLCAANLAPADFCQT